MDLMIRMFFVPFASFTFIMVSFSVIGHAADFSESEVEITDTLYSQEARAKTWRLSVEEWGEYRSLMEGPRGIWSPSLDPITVLGIHAESDTERRRYAELLVMIEYERVESELRFQRAYDEAAQRLFPSLAPVTLTVSNEAITLVPGVERIAYFGSVDSDRCPQCQDELVTLLQARLDPSAPTLDLFLADASDDETIRVWARAQGVTFDDVRAGRITLNHAGNAAVPAIEERIAPRLMQRSAGQWRSIASGR